MVLKQKEFLGKSPSIIKLNKLKNRIKIKNYLLNDNNVHIYASLLKTYLRELNDSIVPIKYYNYCIDMTKKNKLNKQHFDILLSQLPKVNRELIKYLIKFLTQLLLDDNTVITKMNLENVAIVFGPSFLRSPKDLDPQLQLFNAKYEKEFVVKLVQNCTTN